MIFELNVFGTKNVQSVAVRGGDQPLSWETDRDMTLVVKDSLYRLAVTFKTGYLVTRVKFTINGELELQDKPNRRVVFGSGDTTFCRARFDRDP